MTIDLDAIHAALPPMTSRIRLVVSDIDGTLLGPDKTLSAGTIEAARLLKASGIALCLVSSRSARGMIRYHRELGLETPFGALNGGAIVSADDEILSHLVLPEPCVASACDVLSVHAIDTWLFRDHDWLVRDPGTPYVAHESKVVGLAPTVVPDFSACLGGVGKIMAASSNAALLARMEIEIGAMLRGEASVHRSSEYYLDITHRDANKGFAARELAARLGVSMEEVACIGDMSNDVPMLDCAGLGIAMGNASAEVRAHAHVTTGRNDAEGWAEAMHRYVLPRAPVAA
ncbi:Cof-type HAD-IIB family hydrolase [Swaminathania salitolerans]|uniref:Haloacid dehalogenase n=1 Tax=Swaminathania salitolerans TaxID=182838 RepID=A0A511BM28_9PROT|nr:Cof-type HAD-IIB family hydrolase [Swaminathania salitolerans]GBQ15510.1 hydrolase [Swaminathania salitolerans LMG 21291]GEL01386.1 haloacid dehalogenase [Swaminathania salitolerans]